jgi:RHS repeat-associated protein
VAPGACLYALDPTATDAFQIAGAQSVYTACGVVAESSASSAFEMEGSETLYLENHAQVSVVGEAQLNGQTYLYDTISGKDVQAVRVTSPGDPLSSIAAPTSGAIVSKSPANYSMNSKPPNDTLSAGVYCGGLTIGNTNGATFTFSPGVYIMAGGGLTLNSQAVVSGTGVTIYNTSSAGWGCSGTYNYTPVTISGQVTASLSAPTSGSFDGILFFGNRNGCSTAGSCTDQINGGSTAILNGALYFASDKLEITGSNASGYMMLVADKIYINGNSNFGENGSPFDDITVSVSPATASLYANQTQQFTATVNNTGNTAVNWTLSPSSAGSVSSSGLFTAPSSITTQQTVTVTATSQADDTKTASATITLYPPINVSVTPASATLYAGQTQQFTASVTNANSSAVTWTISPAGVGSITASGLYTAPSTISSVQSVIVTATSQVNSSAAASATISLMPPIAVSISPNTATLYGAEAQQFTATVTNSSNTTVTWSISPAGTGTISASGLYTAPATIATQETVTITAASQANSSATATATVTLSPPIAVSLSPSTGTLNANQTLQFSATVANTSNTAVAWSINPSGLGSINSSGLYTAPANIATAQTVTITATSQANSSATATATVDLLPSITVTITPSTATVAAGQSLQFTASVSNSSNAAVTWTIAPSGAGTVSASGLYTAPASITAEQTVTVTATSQADTAQSASVVVTLTPAPCVTNGYSYMRMITIDHTKVPNTDQANFPFLFNTTDPLLANTASGGHVTSPAGNDIIFTSDPSGLTVLNYELEEYNPATGQVIAWVRVPNLSHNMDTVIYMFYGNSNVSTPQQNPAGVWDSTYEGVWHLANGTVLSTNDSTTHSNNGTDYGATATTGEIDGAASFNGNSYIDIGNMGSFPAQGMIEFWMQPSSLSSYPNAFTTNYNGGNNGIRFEEDSSGDFSVAIGNGDFNGYSFTSGGLVPNAWYQVVLTWDTASSTAAGYINGMPAFNVNSSNLWPSTLQNVAIGSGYNTGRNWNGIIDEVRVANAARSADWVATEYNNQSSPQSFYSFSAENPESVAPGNVTLYASQFQQFAIAGICNAGNAVWTMPAGSPGTLTADGLYTAPENIQTQQTVTITGTSLGASSAPLTATITLMPPVAISVTPPSAILSAGQSQQLTASVINTSNTAVTWTISPAGTGTVSTTGLFTAPSSVSALQTVNVTATSVADITQFATATLTLIPAAGLPGLQIGLAPISTILYAGESQQFTVSVTGTNNSAVTWSLSPAGVGTVSASGLYTPPSSITSQQTVVITATSQANPEQSASSTIVLAPAACAASGYQYVRQIIIDHTQVPNTDQTSFPFLFNTTDPLLATVANNGHVANPNGYDIMFSTDPNGLSSLNYEVEEYDPAKGQLVAWVNIPTLSHTADTILYLFYGNPSITTSQQNPSGVWDSNFEAVYHLANLGSGTAFDSTANGNNGTLSNVAAVTSGEIAGGASFNGTSSEITTNYVQNAATAYTVEAWVNTTSPNLGIVVSDQGDGGQSLTLGLDGPGGCGEGVGCGQLLGLRNDTGYAMFLDDSNTAYIGREGGTSLNDGNWHQIVGTYSASSGTSIDRTNFAIFIDGQIDFTNFEQDGSDTSPLTGSGGTILGAGMGGFYQGTMDEVRISNSARSSDWIATEFNNQKPNSTFYMLSQELNAGVTPGNVTLFASQSQQFTAIGMCSPGLTWSMPAGSPGTLSSTGLYTAPASISEQQTVTVTATNGSNQSASATVTLMPAISFAVEPATATLTPSQTQLFSASITGASDQSVTWSISPAGVGIIDSTGVYTAPATISAQQTVTITATSEAYPSQSASATVTLAPSQCASSGYGYQRVIVIDHTKVPNTDQTNFPFLFDTTDSDLAYVSNGGHVSNPNGDDIFFSTDPNGLTKLDHEIESYNPSNGQLIAWVRIPTLSHTTDTVLYLFYGNPNITTPQQNPSGVWSGSYQAVYHLANVTGTAASDSTAFGNNAPLTSVATATGEIDGAVQLNGSSSYLQLPAADFPNYPTGTYSDLGLPSTSPTGSFTASFGVWFKTASAGGILFQVPSQYCSQYLIGGVCANEATSVPGGFQPGAGNTQPGGWNTMLYVDDTGHLVGPGTSSTATVNDNNWHYAVVTFANDGTNTLYVDGQNVSSGSGLQTGYNSAYSYFVGSAFTWQVFEGNWNWLYFNGDLDEISVTNNVLSGDWIQTEYNNQSSPATFYKYYPIGAVQVAPSAVNLYAAETQQFTVPGSCDAAVTFSIPSGAPGSITTAGFYIAPEVVSSSANVTVTASNAGGQVGTATVTLLPPPAPITLTASAQAPYATGTSQSFAATVLNPDGTPVVGATVSFLVSGANSATGTETTNNSGIATYSYTGANTGSDTIQATASVNGNLLSSNSVTASWINPIPPAEMAGITLSGPPALGAVGLVGAFTDSTGKVIEPIAVGASASEFIVPAGATQLQLGVDSAYYTLDGGTGYTVLVEGSPVTVPPTAMPWTWTASGLNAAYQYGIYAPSIQSGVLDGTNAVPAAMGLTAGQIVTIAYQSGTATESQSLRPLVNANGDQGWVTSLNEWQGTYFPTFYTSTSAYPVGQPIPFSALVTNSAGAPAANVPVTLTVTGANPGEYTATTDSTGTATFLYTGAYAGADSLVAQATPAGGASLTSSLSSVTWVNSAYVPLSTSSPSLKLNPLGIDEDAQGFYATLLDGSGNPITSANIGFYVWGVDNFSESGTTDLDGNSVFTYDHTNPGNYNLVAVATVNGNVIFSNVFTGTWTPPNATSTCNGCNSVTVSIAANTSVTIPNALTLTGTVTDSVGESPTISWTQVSGPGVVTFANPQQAATTATFSQIGTYVVQLSASDSGNSATAQFQVSVIPPVVATSAQGWVGSPVYGSAVSGLVPITLAPGISLASGTLSYMPASNTNNVTPLNINLSAPNQQIGTFDTTGLANGSYWIQLQATDTSGNSQYSLILVTVTGNYKPGRVTTTVTDLVVPSTGIAISIQRTYDSLNAGTSSDFGYGWSLGVNVNLSVDPKGDVTLTLGGQTRTFYLTPQVYGCTAAGCLFPYYFVTYTPEAGMHGTLVDAVPGCPLDIVVPNGSLWECQDGSQFSPGAYTYTDPNGTQYSISATGGLQSITDKNGNGLTITPNGITSTTGLNVPFVRDDQNRITQITDPEGNVYSYSYDANGNLATVTYPPTASSTVCSGVSTPNTSQYTYYPNHYYESGTDGRCNPLPSTSYFGAGQLDASGIYSVAGKLASVTDSLNETTSYVYNLSTNTTTVTYPPDESGKVGTATMVYDSLGDLLSSTDPNGFTTTNTYDANQNLLSTTDPLGHTTSYTYDVNGNKLSQTYPATATSTNTTSTTSYNAYSEPTSTTDELGNVRTFNYDGNFNPQSVTDGLGTLMSTIFNSDGTMQSGAIGYDITQNPTRASQFGYDANGNLISKTDALGRATTYSYNSLGQKVSMTEPLLNSGTSTAQATTTYQYDPFGNLTQTSAPLGRVTSSTYDSNGNKTSDTDARGNVTQYQYDALNRLVLTTYPDGTTASKTYDFRNNVVTETDQDGHVTYHQYDIAGRQTAVTQAYGTANATTTSYAYDNAGRMTSQTDALGHVTNFTYDAANDLLSTSGVKGNFSYTYDNARNRISQTDGDGHTTRYAYDARKRLTVTTYPDGTTTTNAYDGPGNLVSVTDQAGNQVQYTYDAANQLSSVVQTNSPNTANTTIYGYDANGNPIVLEDANSHETLQSFDLLSELTGKTLPDGTLTESRTYDSNGNLATVTHFNGVTTTYTYDQLNRLLSRATPNEATVTFTYTDTGKRQSMTDQSGTTNYTYDPMDRLQTKATPEGTLTYGYDAAGNLASIQSSNVHGTSVSYTYDSLSRLSTVTDGNLAGLNPTQYSYDNASNVGTVTYPNGVATQFTYDTLNRVLTASSQVSSYTYQRGPTGNLTNVVELGGRTANWTYDGIYRLTNESIAGGLANGNGNVSYGLDPVGNRLSEASSITGLTSGTWGYNADDEVSSESYDLNGNVTQTGGKSFTYDSENHLMTMTASGTSVSIIYDGDGNRVSKTVNGVTTQYLVDDLNPTGYPQVMEELQSGAVTRQYTYGLQRIDEDQPISNVWTPSFYGYDGGGSVRQLTNSSGTVTDQYEYDAYGNSFTVSGTTPNEMLYRGEQYDSDLGLYYLRARYYNPATGRFMSRDPLDGLPWDPKTLHKYLYVGSDPLNYVDPGGKEYLEFAIEQSAAIPEAKLIDIYGCLVDASLTAVNLIINPTIKGSTVSGGVGAVIGCVALTPGLSELADQGNKIVKFVKLVGVSADWGECAADIKEFVDGLNDLLSGTPDGVQITDALTELGGCVNDALGYMLTHPAKALQGLGLE